ncbi:unnamed protein product, partial [Prorocentrum cordatum]
ALRSLVPGFIAQPRYRSCLDFGHPLEMRVVTLWGKARVGVWWWGRSSDARTPASRTAPRGWCGGPAPPGGRAAPRAGSRSTGTRAATPASRPRWRSSCGPCPPWRPRRRPWPGRWARPSCGRTSSSAARGGASGSTRSPTAAGWTTAGCDEGVPRPTTWKTTARPSPGSCRRHLGTESRLNKVRAPLSRFVGPWADAEHEAPAPAQAPVAFNIVPADDDRVPVPPPPPQQPPSPAPAAAAAGPLADQAAEPSAAGAVIDEMVALEGVEDDAATDAAEPGEVAAPAAGIVPVPCSPARDPAAAQNLSLVTGLRRLARVEGKGGSGTGGLLRSCAATWAPACSRQVWW